MAATRGDQSRNGNGSIRLVGYFLSRKFSKYRDGVGPRWPWYFDPVDFDP